MRKSKAKKGAVAMVPPVPKMTRHSLFIEDSVWDTVKTSRPLTALDSAAAFVRECIRLGAPLVVKKHAIK